MSPIRVLAALGLIAMIGCDKRKPEDTPPAAVEYCSGYQLAPVVEGHEPTLCSEDGTGREPLELRHADGWSVKLLPAGTKVRVFSNSELRRKPGHVDVRICVASGPHAGGVGYVRNTEVFGRSCAP